MPSIVPDTNQPMFLQRAKSAILILELTDHEPESDKLFSKDEYFFKGHFPDNPIVPGVIIVEAMAQTAGIVVSYKLKDYDEKSVLFMSVNKAKFRKPILPNEKVSFEVKFLNSVRDVYKFEGICFKENIKVSEAEFSAMITYK